MVSKKFDFKEQLVVGSQAEEDFIAFYPNPLQVSLDRRWDLLDVSNGKKLELKADTYSPDKYPNFAMERWSDVEAKKPGGPWRSRKDRVDVFIYYFTQTDDYYEFHDIKLLCAELDKHLPNCKEHLVKNKSWVTSVFAVPRVLVEHLATKHVLIRS